MAMSKINSCYSLCPLIDQNSFFGVSDDCENGYVLITLGKNMVVRYKLSDQKQVNSWNTKVRLSSLVIFDRSSRHYVGVFNSNTIRIWTEFDVDLNKVKKYKFTNNIHCVLSNSHVDIDDNSPVIVFKNGCIAPLTSDTLANRKNAQMIGDGIGSDTIEDALLLVSGKNIVVALVCTNSSNNNLYCRFLSLKVDLFQPICFNLSDYRKCPAESNSIDIKLTGYVFISGDPLKLITLWSDGALYCLDCWPSDASSKVINEQYPGQKIMDLEVINTNLKVAILPLDNIGCHIAIYGSDPGEEGALLIIINIKHKVVESKFNLKLYCTSPRLWSGGSSDLLLIIGQYLAVAHYRLVRQKLATLVGTQTDCSLTANVLQTKWQSSVRTQEQSLQVAGCSKAIKSDYGDLLGDDNFLLPLDEDRITLVIENVETLLNEGLPETGVCLRLLPRLIEMDDVSAMIWLFKRFNDVPFQCKLVVINYCLNRIGQNISKDVDSGNQISEFSCNAKDEMDSNVKLLLLSVLSMSLLPDNKALSLVRSELPLTAGLSLMDRLIDFMTECPNNSALIEWSTLLLDSYYQSFIISKNSDMIKTFRRLNDCINNQISFLSTWQDIIPLIKMIKTCNGKQKSVGNSINNYFYNSEELNVY